MEGSMPEVESWSGLPQPVASTQPPSPQPPTQANPAVANQIIQLIRSGQYDQAIQLAEQNGLTQLANYAKALKYANEAVDEARNGNIQKAQLLISKAQSVAFGTNLDLTPYVNYVQIMTLLTEAQDDANKGNYSQAIQLINQAYTLAQSSGVVDPQSIARLKGIYEAQEKINQDIQLANQALQRGDFKTAFEYVNDAYTISQSMGLMSPELVKVRNALYYLSQIPSPPQPVQISSLSSIQNYLNQLVAYFSRAESYATMAGNLYPEFAPLASTYKKSYTVALRLLSVVGELINAQNLASQQDYSRAVQLVNHAETELKNIDASGTPLANLVSNLEMMANEMATKYNAVIQIQNKVDKANQYAQQGDFNQALKELTEAQTIANGNGISVNLENYIQGFKTLASLQPLPSPPESNDLISTYSYLVNVYKTLKENVSVYGQTSKYIPSISPQLLDADINVLKTINDALFQTILLLAEVSPQSINANQIPTPDGSGVTALPKNKHASIASSSPRQLSSPSDFQSQYESIIASIQQQKNEVNNKVNTIVSSLQSVANQPSDFQGTAQAVISTVQQIGQSINTQLEIETRIAKMSYYINQAQYYVSLVNEIVNAMKSNKQQGSNTSVSEVYSKLTTYLQNAYNDVQMAINEANEANSIAMQNGYSQPVVDNNTIQELQQYARSLSDLASVYSALATAFKQIENVTSRAPQSTDPASLEQYYGSLASSIKNAKQVVSNVNVQDADAQKIKNEIVSDLDVLATTYSDIANAYGIIAKSTQETARREQGTQRQIDMSIRLAQAYKNASNYLNTEAQKLSSSGQQTYADVLTNLATSFNKMSQIYDTQAKALEMLENANNASSISQKVNYLREAKAYFDQEKSLLQSFYAGSNQEQQAISTITDVEAKIQDAINTFTKVEQYQNLLQNYLQNGNFAGALIVYNDLLKAVGRGDINDVVNSVIQNNYPRAIAVLQSKDSLDANQKQFLSALIATIAINQYYLPLVKFYLQEAQNHIQKINPWDTFNFSAQMQPVLDNLKKAMDSAVDALQMTNYLPNNTNVQNLQQQLNQLVGQISQQYNVIYNKVKDWGSNPITNVFAGFANTINVGLNNLLNWVNNQLYNFFGKQWWVEYILAPLVDVAIFALISAIPIVGQIFAIISTISFIWEIGSTTYAYIQAGYSPESAVYNALGGPQGIWQFVAMLGMAVLLHKVGGWSAKKLDIRLDRIGVNLDLGSLRGKVKLPDFRLRLPSTLTDLSKKISVRFASVFGKIDLKNTTLSNIRTTITNIGVRTLNDLKARLSIDMSLSDIVLKKLGKVDVSTTISNSIKDASAKATTNVMKEIKNIRVLVNLETIELFRRILSEELSKETKVNVITRVEVTPVKVEPLKFEAEKAVGKNIGEASVSVKATPNVPTEETPIMVEQGGKVSLGVLSLDTIKKLIETNQLGKVVDLIRANYVVKMATQFIEDLKKTNGNEIRLSPEEKLGYLDGNFILIKEKNGQPIDIKSISELEAIAKIAKFIDDRIGDFITANKQTIENLLRSTNDPTQFVYRLSHEMAGNVIRNEYLELKNLTGQSLAKLTSKTEISEKGTEVITTTEVHGANVMPKTPVRYLTPENIDALLASDNTFSTIFKPLIDKYPAVKDVLTSLARKGKLTNNLDDLEKLASHLQNAVNRIESQARGVIDRIKSTGVFDGIDVEKIVKERANQIIETDATDILNGNIPELTVEDVLKKLSIGDKMKVVRNYFDKLKQKSPDVYNEIEKKLSGLSMNGRDYALSYVYNIIMTAVEDGRDPFSKFVVDSVIKTIDTSIKNFEQMKVAVKSESQQVKSGPQQQSNKVSITNQSSTSGSPGSGQQGPQMPQKIVTPPEANLPKTKETTGGEQKQQTGSGGQGTGTLSASGLKLSVEQPKEEARGALTKQQFSLDLRSFLEKFFPEFKTLGEDAKRLVTNQVVDLLESKGKLVTEDFKTIEDMIKRFKSEIDERVKLANELEKIVKTKEEKGVPNRTDETKIVSQLVDLSDKIGVKNTTRLEEIVKDLLTEGKVKEVKSILKDLTELRPDEQVTIISVTDLERLATDVKPILMTLQKELDAGKTIEETTPILNKVKTVLKEYGVDLKNTKEVSAILELAEKADKIKSIIENELKGLEGKFKWFIVTVNPQLGKITLRPVTTSSISPTGEPTQIQNIDINLSPITATSLSKIVAELVNELTLETPPLPNPEEIKEPPQGPSGTSVQNLPNNNPSAEFKSKKQYLFL